MAESRGSLVLIVGNSSEKGHDVAVQLDGKALLMHLPGTSMVTLRLHRESH